MKGKFVNISKPIFILKQTKQLQL